MWTSEYANRQNWTVWYNYLGGLELVEKRNKDEILTGQKKFIEIMVCFFKIESEKTLL